MTHTPRILITGGCGYLGSQLIRDLARSDSNRNTTIRILDNLQQGSVRALMNLPEDSQFEFIEGDILDPSVTRLALHDVDAVIHLAALVRTPLSFENPAWMEQVNHWGTSQLVEACLSAGVRRLVFASSTAVYGPGGPCSEEDHCRPQGAYAQSKLAAENSIRAACTRGLQACILRLGSLYGLAPVMRFDAVANRLAYLAGVGRSLTVYGTGNQRRPFLHVRDASSAICHGLSRLCEQPESVFNVVQESASILELVEAIQRVKPEVKVHFTDQDLRTHYSFEVDGASIRKTGWKPEETLIGGLHEILVRFTGLRPALAGGHDIDDD